MLLREVVTPLTTAVVVVVGSVDRVRVDDFCWKTAISNSTRASEPRKERNVRQFPVSDKIPGTFYNIIVLLLGVEESLVGIRHKGQ